MAKQSHGVGDRRDRGVARAIVRFEARPRTNAIVRRPRSEPWFPTRARLPAGAPTALHALLLETGTPIPATRAFAVAPGDVIRLLVQQARSAALAIRAPTPMYVGTIRAVHVPAHGAAQHVNDV